MAASNNKKMTAAEKSEMLSELLVVKNVKNVKMIKLVHFKVHEEDFYANTYTDLDRYIESIVPLMDAQNLMRAQRNHYEANRTMTRKKAEKMNYNYIKRRNYFYKYR